MKNYKDIVSKIIHLDWSRIEPEQIIWASYITAVEFAESLRIACDLYPDDLFLAEMARGELNTDNLDFGNYSKIKGDHWRFLNHFIRGNDRYLPKTDIGIFYEDEMDKFSSEERAMTVFSREQELPNIFEKILESHDWNKKGFNFYRYYLERHIELDSGSGSHSELTSHFNLKPDVLYRFYTLRYELYKKLF